MVHDVLVHNRTMLQHNIYHHRVTTTTQVGVLIEGTLPQQELEPLAVATTMTMGATQTVTGIVITVIATCRMPRDVELQE